MAGCNSCGKGSKKLNSNISSTSIISAIPEVDRMEVIYLGGAYSHRIISPHGALYKYGMANYGTGQYGKKLIIHKDDYPPKDGVKLFEEVVTLEPIIVQSVEIVDDDSELEPENDFEPQSEEVSTPTKTKSLFGVLK
jgi:hypothetical protein